MSDIDDHVRAIVRDELAKALAERAAVAEHVTVAEYAKRWSLSTSTVRAAIRDGRLPVKRIGRAVRVDADAEITARSATKRVDKTLMRLLRGGR